MAVDEGQGPRTEKNYCQAIISRPRLKGKISRATGETAIELAVRGHRKVTRRKGRPAMSGMTEAEGNNAGRE